MGQGLLRLGPKTGPFTRALLGDEDALVIDIWVSRALGVEPKHLDRKLTRAKAEKRLRAAARRLGWPVAQLQAAVWTGAYLRHFQNGNPPPFNIQKYLPGATP